MTRIEELEASDAAVGRSENIEVIVGETLRGGVAEEVYEAAVNRAEPEELEGDRRRPGSAGEIDTSLREGVGEV